MSKVVIAFIVLLLIGIGTYFFFSQSSGTTLKERSFTIQDQQFSILAPRDSILERVEAGVANKVYFEYLKSDNISIVHIENVTQTELDSTSRFYEDCINYDQLGFTWNSKVIEVCDVDASFVAEGKRSFQDEEIQKKFEKYEEKLEADKPGRRWFGALLETKGQYYEVKVFVGRKYLEADEAKSKVKQVFESFSVKE